MPLAVFFLVLTLVLAIHRPRGAGASWSALAATIAAVASGTGLWNGEGLDWNAAGARIAASWTSMRSVLTIPDPDTARWLAQYGQALAWTATGVALLGAVVLVLRGGWRALRNVRRAVLGGWGVTGLALCAAAPLLWQSGLVSGLVAWMPGLPAGTPAHAGVVPAWESGPPTALLGTLAMETLGIVQRLAVASGLATGTGATSVGSLATVLWLQLLRGRWLRRGLGRRLRQGLLVALPVLLPGLGALALRAG